MNNDKLIEKIRKFPVLYGHFNENYINSENKECGK